MSQSKTNFLFKILSVFCVSFMVNTALADTGTLIDSVKSVESQTNKQERLFEQDIKITEAGIYQLQAVEVAGSKKTSQLSAVLVAGNQQLISSENGTLSNGVNLALGDYKLIVSHTMPSSASWVSIKSSLLHSGAELFPHLETFINKALTESEKVLRFDLKKDDFLPSNETGTMLSVLDLGTPVAASIFTQIVDANGVVVTQAGEGISPFTFDENAELLLYVQLADGANEAKINVQVAGQTVGTVGTDDVISIKREQTPTELPPDTQLLDIPVQLGTKVTVSLRGIDLGPADDDLGVLITTTPNATNTYKFTQNELLSGVQEEISVTDSDHLYIASYVKTGDMVVVATIKDEQGKVISEQLLAAEHLSDRSEFKQIETFTLATASNVQLQLFDHQYPAKFDAMSVVLWNGDGIIESGSTSVEQTLQKGRYYVAVAAKSSHAGIYHLSAMATDVVDVPAPTPDPTPEPTPTPEAISTPSPTQTPESDESPRSLSGTAGKRSGGGGLGPEWLLVLFGLVAVRQRFDKSSHIKR